MVLVASWNINSINSRMHCLTKFVNEHNPDILLLQEIKCEEHKFPLSAVEDLGYNVYIHGQKSYNGVAILSKSPVEDIFTELVNDDAAPSARYIEGFTSIHGIGLRVASVYVPHGTEVGSNKFELKLAFYKALESRYCKLLLQNEILVAGGDYNVAPEVIDVYDPKGLDGKLGFHIDERRAFRSILNLGMKDSFRVVHPSSHEYSWWDYRSNGWQYNKGMRIDQILLSPGAADRLHSAGINSEIRGWEKASDHAPVFCKLQ